VTFAAGAVSPVTAGAAVPSPARSDAEAAAGRDVADDDSTPDPLIDPLIARAARPPQPVRATLISRLRDQVSLRLALMRGPGGDVDEASAEMPGPDRGAQQVESGETLSAVLRARLDPPAPIDEPAPASTVAAVPVRGVAGPERPATSLWTGVPSFDPAPRADAMNPRVRDLDRGPSKPGRHARQLGDRRWIGPDAGRLDPRPGRFADLHRRVRHLAQQPRRRYLVLAVLAGLAVLVVMVSMLISHAGAPATPLAASTGASSHPAAVAPGTPALNPTTGLQPSASVAPTAAPTVSATPVPTPVPTPLPTPVVATQTYGGAGTGWQLQDVRCCDVQAVTGYTRIVFDLGGTSGADPTATVSFPTSTTMVVTFTGVSASSSIQGDSGGGIVSAVTRQSGSQVTFRLTLSRAATVQGWAFFGGTDAESSAPLHLYFDLS